MKIAIATNDGKRVTGHIGKCRSFMICEIEEGKLLKKELRKNIFTHHRLHGVEHHTTEHEHHYPHSGSGLHSHEGLINGLKDCQYLVSHGGGWRVVEDLKKNNITAIFSDVELIDDAVDKFIKGELKADPDLVCSHN